MIIEAVIPTNAIFILPDSIVSDNTDIFSVLRSGKAHQQLFIGVFFSGSKAEGLSVEPLWGHPWPDMDLMALSGAELGVIIPGQQAPSADHGRESMPPSPITRPYSSSKQSRFLPEVGLAWYNHFNAILQSRPSFAAGHFDSCLEYAPEDCPPAYTRLRVANAPALQRMFPLVGADCVEEEDGHNWLNTQRLNEGLQQVYRTAAKYAYLPDCFHSTDIIGPAQQVEYTLTSPGSKSKIILVYMHAIHHGQKLYVSEYTK